MSGTNRYHLPNLVWHITHPCHNREFLLSFQKDRDPVVLGQVARQLDLRSRFKVVSECPQVDGFSLQEDPALYMPNFGSKNWNKP
jgi:hypothetical protein